MQPPSDTGSVGVLTPDALAATYETPGQLRPWDAVEQYHDTMRVASRNPNKGSTAIATIVELPRERIRTWVDDGGAPDVVRGLDVASRLGWFEDSPGVTTAWATLVAGIYGGGSISADSHQPQWTTKPRLAAERVTAALDTLGLGARTVDRDNRVTQLQSDQYGTLLGRALRALDAPAGRKNNKTVDSLPEWLFEIDTHAQRAAVELLVLYRGQTFPEKDTVELFETRSRSFRETVAALIETVIGKDVNPGNHYVIISAAAARELGFNRNSPLREAIE